MTSDQAPLNPNDASDDQLSPELLAAVQQARQHSPAPEMVESLTQRMTKLNDGARSSIMIERASPLRRKGIRTVAAVLWAGAAIAASIVLLLILLPDRRNGDQPVAGSKTSADEQAPRVPTADLRILRQSAITEIALADAGIERIENDLRLAEAKLATVTESLARNQVLDDVQATLDQYRGPAAFQFTAN